jgi:hypothetical protein
VGGASEPERERRGRVDAGSVEGPAPKEGPCEGAADGECGWAEVTRVGMRGAQDEEPGCGVEGRRVSLPFDCSDAGEERSGSGAVVTTTAGLRVLWDLFPLPFPVVTGELVAVLRLDAAGGGGVLGLLSGTGDRGEV